MKYDLPQHQAHAGSILVAAPDLLDPNFRESLVFLAEHDDQGSFGLILNRPLGKTLGDIVDDAGLSDTLAAVPVYAGGPVRPDQVMLAMFQTGASANDLVCGINADLPKVEAQLEAGEGWVRAFVGYAGWGEGQLDGELRQDAWKVCRPDPALFNERFTPGLWSLFVSGDNRWRSLLDFLPSEPELN